MVAAAVALIAGPAPRFARAEEIRGAILGRVLTRPGGRPLAGVELELDGPTLAARRRATSDHDGEFRFRAVPPGRYALRARRGARATRRDDVVVESGRTTPLAIALGGRATAQRRAVRESTSERLDPTSNSLSTVLGRDDLDRVPWPGPLIDDSFGAAPTAQGDPFGVSLAGASSLENRYLLNGADVGDPADRRLDLELPRELVDQLVITTGGLPADRAGAPGGEVSLVTPRGTDAWHGAVWSRVTDEALSAAARRATTPTTIDDQLTTPFALAAGVALGGPLVRDHLWLHLGIAPRVAAIDDLRTIRRQTDCRAPLADGTVSRCDPVAHRDGRPDVDADGQPILEPVRGGASRRRSLARDTPLVAELDLAVNPSEQGALWFAGSDARTRASLGPGTFEASNVDHRTTVSATGARWTAELGASELRAALSWYQRSFAASAVSEAAAARPDQLTFGRSLPTLAGPGDESAATLAGCHDGGASDPYPYIVNCPVDSYRAGGPGELPDEHASRLDGELGVSHELELAGHHTLGAGLALADERLETGQSLSGGEKRLDYFGGYVDVVHEVEVAPAGPPDPRFDRACGVDLDRAPARCRFLDRSERQSHHVRGGAFVREVWQPAVGLTVDLGLRADQTRIDAAAARHDHAASEPLTLTLWQPRLGLAYDPSRAGRTRLFASLGRYSEAIPLGFDDRAFSREAQLTQRVFPDHSHDDFLFQRTPSPIARGTRAPFVDEAVLGAEAEVAVGFRLGLAFQHRRLGRELEDGGADLTIGNPGEAPAFGAVDRPRRDHDAVIASAVGQPARRLLLRASYSYQRSVGDYVGGYVPETGQLQPHLTSQYDLAELDGNFRGRLPADRPHYLKLDASYLVELSPADAVVVGARLRALSGAPESAAASSIAYGFAEVPLLPRGTVGRIPASERLDLHLGYHRALDRGVDLELYADILDVFDDQAIAEVDPAYTFDDAGPIVGGEYRDLIWAKQRAFFGEPTSVPLSRNRRFNRPTSFFDPRSAALGARLSF